ncbi:hypothetical protein T439DRAFT_359889 [Meredithblackwellia eburnea MCA 4105]
MASHSNIAYIPQRRRSTGHVEGRVQRPVVLRQHFAEEAPARLAKLTTVTDPYELVVKRVRRLVSLDEEVDALIRENQDGRHTEYIEKAEQWIERLWLKLNQEEQELLVRAANEVGDRWFIDMVNERSILDRPTRFDRYPFSSNPVTPTPSIYGGHSSGLSSQAPSIFEA